MQNVNLNGSCNLPKWGSFRVTDSQLKSLKLDLLSIGEEAGKRKLADKDSFEILNSGDWETVSQQNLSEIEERLMSGAVDVVVTDGFTGNVALKTLEGTAKP